MSPIRTENLGARVPHLGNLLNVPRSWDAIVTEEPGITGTIRVTVEYDAGLRRTVAAAVAVERRGSGDEITSLTLREVRVQAAVQRSGLSAVSVLVDNESVSAAEFLRRVRDHKPASPIETVRNAAAVYQIATVINLPPLKTVAETLRVSQSTATRIVNRARTSGMLSDANSRGRAGQSPADAAPVSGRERGRRSSGGIA